MKSVFEQEVGEDTTEDFLVKLRRKKKHECKPNYRDECHQLQKLVDNGEQSDHAEAAKLNKVVTAHQKNKGREHECY
jgi:hypothetical protein